MYLFHKSEIDKERIDHKKKVKKMDKAQTIGQPTKKWLNFGWKSMATYGIFFIALSIFVPIVSYLTYPKQPMIVFGHADTQFTGLSWDKIMAFSPDLGLWLVFSMVSMCAMMMLGGILTFMIARGPYRRGERWAWKALLIGNLVSNGYYVLIYLAHVSRGIYPIVPGASGLGADPVFLIGFVWLYVGLWLPRKELHD